MAAWIVVTTSLAYIGLLFAVAWIGDRKGDKGLGTRHAPVLYALTLAVYMTGWSFYGHIGRAATSGFDFLPIYLGPVIALVFGQAILRRVLAVTKTQAITSLADFIAARYGKSQGLAALVTLIAVVGILPYIALQLRTVATSFDLLTGGGSADGAPWADTGFHVTIALALFAILFGVRHIHASEHHRGLMLAIAFESLVKLAAFLAVAGLIVFGLQDGLAGLYGRAASDPALSQVLAVRALEPSWWSTIILSAMAVLTLPQTFHVAVVENRHPADLRWAALLFPAYLAILSVFMVPVAAAGILTFGNGTVNPDTYMMALPIAAGEPLFGLIAFLGGLSASTAMVIVATVALSTMVCNDMVMPLLLRRGAAAAGDVAGRLLTIRRLAVVGILLLAYVNYRLLPDAYSLTTIGMLSFVAVGQFGPALLGGLAWERGNRRGALAGLVGGFAMWGYTMLWPTVAQSMLGALPPPPFGLDWLTSTRLLGLGGMDMVSHATLCSLTVNLALYVLVSLATRRTPVERQQAAAFRRATLTPLPDLRVPRGRKPLRELRDLAERFVGAERARVAFDRYLAERAPTLGPDALDRPADLEAIRFTEHLLAGAIGAASARVVVATAMVTGTLSRGEAMAMLDDASHALRINRELLAATLENMAQGILVLDRGLVIAAWNRRFLDVLGLPEDVVRVGTPLADLVDFLAERGEYREDDLLVLIVNRPVDEMSWPYVYERVRPDGSILEVTTARMPDGGFVATYTDVTERHRTAALAAAKAEAERANLGKTRFLAAASHDLLQPLSAARLFSSALSERPLPEREGELVRNLDRALQSVEELLGTLLDISRMDAGGLTVSRQVVPLGPLLDGLAQEAQAGAEAKGLRLATLPCSLAVDTDPLLLRRILRNLLSNAVRYTERGRILLGCRRNGDKVRIEVWDTGPGIPAGQLETVFEEFRRLQPTAPGLGLGLAIVDRLARLLEHPVSVRSVPGRGSCFAVEVPVGQPPATPPSPAAGFGHELVDLQVLCLDNDPAVLEGLAALLLQWRCQVRGVTTADAALLGPAPDVMIVDRHLDDGASGLDAVRMLRAAHGPVPALLLTADRSAEVREEAATLAVPVVYKPLRPAQLRAALSHLAARVPVRA